MCQIRDLSGRNDAGTCVFTCLTGGVVRERTHRYGRHADRPASMFARWFPGATHDWTGLVHRQADRAGNRLESYKRDQSTKPNRRGGRRQSIKRRVIRLVLVPSIVALVLWLVASGYLVFQGFYNREVANSVRTVSIPAVSALASIQQERRLSVAFLAQPSKGLQELLDQRQETDRPLSVRPGDVR